MNKIKHTITILLSLLMVIGLMTPGAVADEGDTSSEEYEEWQTESDNYSEDEVTVTIVLEGLETAEIRIADSETWESVADGDSVKALRSNSMMFIPLRKKREISAISAILFFTMPCRILMCVLSISSIIPRFIISLLPYG